MNRWLDTGCLCTIGYYFLVSTSDDATNFRSVFFQACAVVLAKEGAGIILTARSEDQLKEVTSPNYVNTGVQAEWPSLIRAVAASSYCRFQAETFYTL